MSLDCPQCASSHTQLLSIAYSSGLNTSQAVTHTREAFGIGTTHVHKTVAVQQSDLSRQAAPPAKRPIGTPIKYGVLAGALLGFVTMFIDSSVLGPLPFLVGFFGPIGFALYRAYQNFTYNRGEWVAEMALWQQCYVCLRCGMVFNPVVEDARVLVGEPVYDAEPLTDQGVGASLPPTLVQKSAVK